MIQYEENKRVVGDFVVTRSDPYGFWTVQKARGATPKVFIGQSFTTSRAAYEAIDNYLKNKG